MSLMTTCAQTLALILLTGSVALAQDEGAAADAPDAPLWLIGCSNEGSPDQLLCELSQSIVMTAQNGQNQRVAGMAFRRVAGQPGTTALLTLPLEVSLNEPVAISVDGAPVTNLAWQSCDGFGCYATAPVDEPWLKAMRGGKLLSTAFHASDGRQISFDFQLAGFTRTEALMP